MTAHCGFMEQASQAEAWLLVASCPCINPSPTSQTAHGGFVPVHPPGLISVPN